MKRNKPLSPTMKRKFERSGCVFKEHPDDDEHRQIGGGSGLGLCGFGPDGGFIAPESDGDYFRWLARSGIYAPLRADSAHSSASIGKIGIGEYAGKWAGWSHRASLMFGIGDLLFEEKYVLTDETLFRNAGEVVIKTEEQARQAASNFSKYVS